MSHSTENHDPDDEDTGGHLQKLAALSAAAVGVSLAGCTGDDGDGQDDTPGGQETDTESTTEPSQTTTEPGQTTTDDGEEYPDLADLSTSELTDMQPPEYEQEVELGMVIDLQRCVGCDSCNIACKQENNVEEGKAWAHRIKETSGTFPDVAYEYKPNLCNQCRDAPCMDACPTPALNKGPGGITMQDPDACIGCWQCVGACPYDKSFKNERGEETHTRWRSTEATMNGMASPSEVTEEAGGDVLPYSNPNRERDDHASGLREPGIAEKCTLCYHRVRDQELPACVEECPTDARIMGDLDDPDSTVSELIDKYGSWRWKEEEGTEPKVHYIREFDGSDEQDGHDAGKGNVPEIKERHELYR
ncbi:MAG: 4Fe-4S dicluster domain-containing protein [Halapricum sp.]